MSTPMATSGVVAEGEAIAAAEVGHKFARLFAMRAAGLPVPPLVCVPASRFDEAIGPLRPQIERELARADFASPGTVRAAAARIRALIMAVPTEPPAGLSCRGLVAVRACVVGAEDSAADPYAGMSDSFLYVPPGEVAGRIQACWASGFNAESLLYRHVQGLDLADVRVAVGVQEMVAGQRSFVLFTRDPRTGDDVTVVAAGHGIGEGVVREKVGVDHFFLRGKTIATRVTEKPEMIGPGLTPEPVAPELRNAPVLTDGEVRQLAGLGRRIEDLFGGPQDIEGTFTADGAVHIVQARPIAIDPSLRRQWSNANVTESFPGVTGTLTYTFARTFYRAIFYDLYRRLGVDTRTLHRNERYLDRMIGLHHGRVYYDLGSWYQLHRQLTVFGFFQASWEQMMGIDPGPREPRPPWWRLLPVAAKFATHDRAMHGFEAWWQSVIGPRRGARPADPLAAIQDFHEVWRQVGDHWGVTLINDSALSTYTGLAQRLLARWAPGEPLNDLLCGDEHNHSVEIMLSTVRLAEQVRERPGLLGDLAARPVRDVWDDLQRDGYGAALRVAFGQHLDRYGDRGLQELKMEQPGFRAAPWELLEIVAGYAESDLTADGLRRREAAIRDAAEARLRARLGPVRRWVLRAVLARLRRAAGYRENSRYCRSELFGLAKALFSQLGEALAQRGVLRDAADACHLTMDELVGWFDGTGPSESLQPLADARRHDTGPELPMRFATLGPARDSRPALVDPAGGDLTGLGSSGGTVRGVARVMLDPREPIEPGSILVARETDPGWLFLMLRAAGIVVERGTMLSHTAITARKFGIPAIVALPGATTKIPDGAMIEMDGASGRVVLLETPC